MTGADACTTKLERRKKAWRELEFSVQWRAAVVRLPRLVPRPALRILAPEGPYPHIIKLPTRSKRLMAVWTFLPPRNKIVDKGGNVAVHIDFRGGGFFMGSCMEQAPFCSKIARERGCIVLCPDHAMGPLRQFPAALEDAEDVLSAVLDTNMETDAGRVLHTSIQHYYLPRKSNFRKSSSKQAHTELVVDASRISLSGFSSGGNLALNLVMSSTSEDGDGDWPCLIPKTSSLIPVLLFYPAVHQLELPMDRPPAKRRLDIRPGRFARSLDRHLVRSYLPEHLRNHPRANPGLLDQRQMHPQARLFVVVSGKDTLVDQVGEWIERVHACGVVPDVEVFDAPRMKHGFVNLPERAIARDTFRAKRQAYGAMQAFWDRVAAQAGHPRPPAMKRVDTTPDDS